MPNTEILVLLTTCRCDYRCIFCTMGSRAFARDRDEEIARIDRGEERERIRGILCRGRADAAGALRIMGNDPSNHPLLVETVAMAVEAGYGKVTLETIGIALSDESFTRRLVEAGVSGFKIPVYGASAEVHDTITRMPGGFAMLMRAFENLAKHEVRVELHCLILKQNLDDLSSLEFPWPVKFRFPFFHEAAELPYERYCPDISEVPREVMLGCDLEIPCVNGRVMSGGRNQEQRYRAQEPRERQPDDHMIKVKPSKCDEGSCSDYGVCGGIYPDYLRVHGGGAFRPGRSLAGRTGDKVKAIPSVLRRVLRAKR